VIENDFSVRRMVDVPIVRETEDEDEEGTTEASEGAGLGVGVPAAAEEETGGVLVPEESAMMRVEDDNTEYKGTQTIQREQRGRKKKGKGGGGSGRKAHNLLEPEQNLDSVYLLHARYIYSTSLRHVTDRHLTLCRSWTSGDRSREYMLRLES
jgi:hypothetical protein